MGHFHALDVGRETHSDQEASLENEERGVASWATSFEKLLDDTEGLRTFAEFLKKEFSHENIHFWVACEKFRGITDEIERKKAARVIFDRHLCLGALEPVNVDSHARQVTQEKLGEAAPDLFMQAQKQIFNLMKFDSYPRFIKSGLYKDCLVQQISGEELPFPGGDSVEIGLQLKNKSSPKSHNKLKKSRSDAEDCRRKSLLPWHRKNRSKSKDRGESEYNKLRMLQQKRDTEDAVSVHSDVTSSRSSLVSWDLALRGSFSRQSLASNDIQDRENCALCRVILPDGATTVVQTRRGENVRDLVIRLLDKRGLHYSTFEVYSGTGGKPQSISLDDESTVLGSKEVCVEQRVVFRLDLPSRKTVGVKAKPSKTLAEVLRPILHKYGYKLDAVALCLMSENEVLELSRAVTTVDGQRLQVLTKNVEGWKNEIVQKLKSGPTLDEITNRVFQELLQGKTDDFRTASDQGSIRESHAKGKKVCGGGGGGGSSSTSSKPTVDDADTKSTCKQPLILKWKVSAKLQGRSESEELYEGLKRAQRSRLEDQRGTEINFELPDFLKDKENAPQAGKKIRKLRRPEEPNSKFYEALETNTQSQGLGSSNESLVMGAASNKHEFRADKEASVNMSRFFDSTFNSEAVISNPRPSKDYFMSHPSPVIVNYITNRDGTATATNHTGSEKVLSSSTSKSIENVNCRSSLETHVIDSGFLDDKLQHESVDDLTSPRSRHLSDPPPLPPKPKHLPAKASLWGTSNPSAFRSSSEIAANNARYPRPSEMKRDAKVPRGRKAVYLDQPSSSFV